MFVFQNLTNQFHDYKHNIEIYLIDSVHVYQSYVFCMFKTIYICLINRWVSFSEDFFQTIRYIENYAEQITSRENNLDDLNTLHKQQQF